MLLIAITNIDGSYIAPFLATSTPFGQVAFDPSLPFSILELYTYTLSCVRLSITNVETQDVVNFFKIFKFDVSKFQGSAKQISNTPPRLRLNCQISQKELAVCGDVLEICDVYYLNMITMYGRFTMISMLSSKAAIDLVEKLIAILQKLGSYGWKVKHLVFDSEGSILSQKNEIERRTQLKVYVYSHGNKVGLAELNNRCMRERVYAKVPRSSKYS